MGKAGKFLNPADKARREARKKELKKNKKQRHQVRSAAIESKDPEQLISDLEKLDRLEFDAATNPTFSDTLYKDKRKKLKDTWAKILTYYAKEDPEKHTKLKKVESEYENRHRKLAKEFESIKAAQDLKIEDVFLPPEVGNAIDDIPEDDLLMSESLYVTPFTDGIKPPGCPPGLPPDLKQLVESLSSSMAPLPIEAQTLPPQLRDLPQDSIHHQRGAQRNKPRNEPDRFRHTKSTPQMNQEKSLKDSGREQTSSNPPAERPAVIESKPILFKPKPNKFIPSSVRSKLQKNPDNK